MGAPIQTGIGYGCSVGSSGEATPWSRQNACQAACTGIGGSRFP
jgi:hypothetical protein